MYSLLPFIKARKMTKKDGVWNITGNMEFIKSDRIVAFYQEDGTGSWLVRWLVPGKKTTNLYKVDDQQYIGYFSQYLSPPTLF